MCVHTPLHFVCSTRVFGAHASFLTYYADRFPNYQPSTKFHVTDKCLIMYVGSLSLHDHCVHLHAAVPCEELVDHLAECWGLWVMLMLLLLLLSVLLLLLLFWVSFPTIYRQHLLVVFTISISLKLPPWFVGALLVSNFLCFIYIAQKNEQCMKYIAY